MTPPMIRTTALSRTFVAKKRTIEAVRDLDLTVEQGELVALLGPNGAGKSTTLRMLTTLIPPTSGTAEVASHDVVAEQRAVRSRIGFIGQGNGAGHSQRGRDELISQGRSYGMDRAAARARAQELIESLDLADVADRTVSGLSGGQRRRLDIAMGLIHAPRLLFLDEPSTGLDPQNRANLQDHIRDLRARRETTVVLTTHYLDEADALAERVVVIDEGRLIADDAPDRLKAELVGDLLTLELGSVHTATVAAARVGSGLPDAEVAVEGTRVTARTRDGAARAVAVLRDLDAAGVDVRGLDVRRATLDDVFLHLTGRSLREGNNTAGTPTTAPLEGATR